MDMIDPTFTEPFEYSINQEDIKLPIKLIKEWFRSEVYNNDEFENQISNAISKIRFLKNIRCGFRIFQSNEVEIKKERIRISDSEFNTGNIITKRFRKSDMMCIFVATAGPELEKESKELMSKGEMLEGYLLDVIGSELAEEAGNILEGKLNGIVSQYGFQTTNRYSPGYCNWDVSEQQKLFRLLPNGFCGVNLTESSLMIPIKSISGFIGIGEKAEREDYQCNICDVEYCFKRNKNE